MIAAMLRAVVIAIALCACRDRQLEAVKAVREEVCACQTVKCGEDAMKKLPPVTGSPGHRAQALAAEITTCLSKLYLKERPDEDPDAKAAP
jgi:hypothetical protein